jgi:uncharacterized membrane protein
MKKTTQLSILAAAATVAVAGVATEAEAKSEKEKCFGVSKAGKNDCGSSGHACAGQAKVDGDTAEWVYAPKGLCEKLNGGSLESSAK